MASVESASAVRLSVPGKVILIGEHAAVYGRPAVVAAVDPRLWVEADLRPPARSGSGGEVRLLLPDVGVDEVRPWGELAAAADRARRRWRAFEAGAAPFVADGDAGALVRIAVGEALTSLPESAAARLTAGDLKLRLRSEIPVGAGLGSSAAAAVGVVAAVRALAGRKAELEAIAAAALEVERRQHGLPSGIDSGVVLRGGVLLVRSDGGPQRFEELAQPDWLAAEIEVVNTGAPDQTTGAVVAGVRERRREEPERTAAVLDRVGAASVAFRTAIDDDRRQEAMAAIAAGHRALVDLGVVPPAIAARIERVEAAGGAAKISGAGALEGTAAGALICMLGGRPPETIDGLSDLQSVNARIGADGLRFESGSADRL